MYIITSTNNNKVLIISPTLEYLSNGNALVNNGTLAIAKYLIENVYEKAENDISAEVIPNKYCYTEAEGFFIDPNWQETYTEEERISALEDMVNNLLGF